MIRSFRLIPFFHYHMTIRQLLTRPNSNLQALRFLPATRIPSLFSLLSHKSTTNLNPSGASIHKEETLVSLLKKCSSMKELNQIHAHIVRTGFEHGLFVVGKVIVFCAVSENGDMGYAVSVFQRIKNPDGFIWNSMIRGFSKDSEPLRAFEYYKFMLEEGLVADSFTFSFLIKACGLLGSVSLGKQMHCRALRLGYDSHVFVRNTLIHMYGVFKEVEVSCELFDEIPDPELVAWNSMVDCLVYCGKCEAALDLFLRMLGSGIEPDDATLVAALAACSLLGALDFGRWVHSCVTNTSLGGVIQVNNALMDMYAKCGAVDDALETFSRMRIKSVITWNTMISGLAFNGHSNKALAVFSQMLVQKFVLPDGVTFLAVLTACSHGAMVDEGKRFFEMMINCYHIQPTIKHYGCMVDIFGRAGFLEEAYQLIRSMPMECNAIVWRTLLAACQLHGNVELAKQVRQHILQLEPSHSSDYVLLANMHASAGQWNEVMEVRQSMQRRRVQKHEPGNSTVDTSSF